MSQCFSVRDIAGVGSRFFALVRPHLLLSLCLLVSWSPANAQNLAFADALRMANDGSALLEARRASLEGARALQTSAAQLPDPRISLGIDSLPVNGPHRGSLTRDDFTMRQIGLSQEVPNRGKRAARADAASARSERESALAQLERRNVRRETGLAWLALYFAEQKLDLFKSLLSHDRLLQETAPAQLAAGRISAADVATLKLESLSLDDRRDELLREVAQARAGLARWVGASAITTSAGPAPLFIVDAPLIRSRLEFSPDVAVYSPMLELANAELREADAARNGDWAWSVNYGKRGQGYGDLLSVQLTFELPWAQSQRQQPQILSRLKDVEKTTAEQTDVRQRQLLVFDLLLSELDELDTKLARLNGQVLPLSAQKTALALTNYQTGRDKLAAVLESRKQESETALRALDLQARQRAVQWRINSILAE